MIIDIFGYKRLQIFVFHSVSWNNYFESILMLMMCLWWCLTAAGFLFNTVQVIQLPRNSISLYGNLSTDDHDSLSYEWSLSPESKDKVVEMQVRWGKNELFTYCWSYCSWVSKQCLTVAFVLVRVYEHQSCSCQLCRRETTPSSWLWQTWLASRIRPRWLLLCSQVTIFDCI